MELLYNILYQLPSSPIILTASPSYILPKIVDEIDAPSRILRAILPKS